MSRQKFLQNIQIESNMDLVKARQAIRTIALNLNYGIVNKTKLVTAVSELTRNILLYAGKGEINIELLETDTKKGLRITATDAGPGIPDVDLAVTDGFSTSKGLGKGLSGTKKLMDDFSIQTEVGKGTEVIIIKWMDSDKLRFL